MADRVLFLSWDQPHHGMEERATEAFNETVELMGRMQQDGRIESFDVVLLGPNGDIGGCMIMKGSHEQIAALHDDEEFLRSTVNAQRCVDRIRHIDGWTGEGVARMMAMYQEATAAVRQAV